MMGDEIDLEDLWNKATPQERGQMLEQMANEMGMDAFYDWLVEVFGEDELRKGLERLRAH